MRILHVFDSSVEHPEEPWREKLKKFEKADFFVFPGAENAYFRPKSQTTRKLDDLTVGRTPIDPRGSHGARDSVLS